MKTLYSNEFLGWKIRMNEDFYIFMTKEGFNPLVFVWDCPDDYHSWNCPFGLLYKASECGVQRMNYQYWCENPCEWFYALNEFLRRYTQVPEAIDWEDSESIYFEPDLFTGEIVVKSLNN